MSKHNMLLGYARGKVGSLVFSRLKGQQITKAYNPRPANPKSLSQQTQRTRIGALVNFFRSAIALLDHSFCDRPISWSSYNAFISANLSGSFAWLTRSMIDNGGAVVCPYRISKGGMPPIQVTGTGDNSVTNIALGSLSAIDGNTTVATLSQAMVANNPNILMGDQLSYVSFIQSTLLDGTPQVRTNLYEMTLDGADTRKVRDLLPAQATTVQNGCLAHGSHVADGGFAWILSRRTNGRLDCSTQSIILNSTTLYDTLSSVVAEEAAVTSYDPTPEPFLVPEGAGNPTPDDTTPSVSTVVVGDSPLDPLAVAPIIIQPESSTSGVVEGGNLEGHTVEVAVDGDVRVQMNTITNTLALFTLSNDTEETAQINELRVLVDGEPIVQYVVQDLGE
jgi:hypothetical protein